MRINDAIRLRKSLGYQYGPPPRGFTVINVRDEGSGITLRVFVMNPRTMRLFQSIVRSGEITVEDPKERVRRDPTGSRTFELMMKAWKHSIHHQQQADML